MSRAISLARGGKEAHSGACVALAACLGVLSGAEGAPSVSADREESDDHGTSESRVSTPAARIAPIAARPYFPTFGS